MHRNINYIPAFQTVEREKGEFLKYIIHLDLMKIGIEFWEIGEAQSLDP